MRIVLILTVVAAASVSGAPSCRDKFTYNQGWCIYKTDPADYSYQGAVDVCAAVGAHAPSIHSKEELDFWSDVAYNMTVRHMHFWLDAYCPTAGQPYVWMDGTPTDYMGPNGELRKCEKNYGYHVHIKSSSTANTQLAKYGQNKEPAPALCVYDPLREEVAEDHCPCNPRAVYLDIVFVVDTSDAMSRNIATITIQTALYGLTFGTGPSQSNVAAFAYADIVQTAVNFGTLRSTKDISTFSLPYLGGDSTKLADAITQASSMLSVNGRSYTRKVIVLLSKSFNQLDATDIQDAAREFTGNGGILTSIDYSVGVKGLEQLASPGFYIKDASSNQDLNTDMLYAFCDSNCFCKNGLRPYNVANDRGRDVPNGCYRVSDAAGAYYTAQMNCLKQRGFVSTVHDDSKNLFLASIFPEKTRYWLGLERTAGEFQWADGSHNSYTNWAPGNPVDGLDCVYGQQLTGSGSTWFSAQCADPIRTSMQYACQLRPCSSIFDCSS